MKYIIIKNWKEFQHYKDRNPPWIKLHNSTLDDYEYAQLDDISKLLLISLWMLASRTNNKIPHDLQWIKQKSMINGKINLNNLINSGFISIIEDASTTLADSSKEGGVSVPLEEKRRDREETEREKSIKDFFSSPLIMRFLNHRKAKKATILPDSYEHFYDKFKKWEEAGFTNEFVVNTVIDRGWQSFNPEWVRNIPHGNKKDDGSGLDPFEQRLAEKNKQ